MSVGLRGSLGDQSKILGDAWHDQWLLIVRTLGDVCKTLLLLLPSFVEADAQYLAEYSYWLYPSDYIARFLFSIEYVHWRGVSTLERVALRIPRCRAICGKTDTRH